MKQCGNCEFWDRENAAESLQYEGKSYAQCSNLKSNKSYAYEFNGQDCPVYKERITCENSLDT